MTAAIKEAFANARELMTEAPRPLYRDLPASSAFPVESLGPVLSKAARAIESVVQCPMACAANSVLAVASLAAQGRANVVLPIGQGHRAPLSLFLLTVLDSGERKSTADKMALRPVRDFEQELKEAEAGERHTYAVRLAAHEANAKFLASKHKQDKTMLEAALRELGPVPQPPLLSLIAPSGDQTIEGLFRVYQQGRPSLAMLCDDAATFLGGHSMKVEQKGGTTGILCRAWDGSKLERVRGGDGVSVMYDRRLAQHLMVQSGVAAEFLSDDKFADQGLLARFLIAAPPGRAGTRFRDDGEYSLLAQRAAHDLEAYNNAILALLRAPIAWKNEHDRSLGVEMAALNFSAKARALFVDFANSIEREMGPRGTLVGNKAFASKLPENAARIGGILTLLSNPHAETMDEHDLANGIALTKYYLSEADRLLASGLVDAKLRQAEQLRVWLQEQETDLISLRNIYQLGPNAIRSAARAREAMAVLVEHGWAIPAQGVEVEGRACKEAWRIVQC